MRTNFLTLLLSIWLTALCGCSPQAGAPVPSPDGSLTLRTSVEQSHADPKTYGCVIFEIYDANGRILHRENTRASSFQRWNIRWLSNDQIQLQSSDIGTYTWSRQPENIWQKKP